MARMATSGNSDSRFDHRRQPTPETWREAEDLLRSQPALRSRLGEVFRSFPPTGGLYSDENVDGAASGDDEDEKLRRRSRSLFADYAGYVRAALAVSPSTIIRRAADASLAELCRSRPESMGELYDLVGLKRVVGGGGVGDDRGQRAEEEGEKVVGIRGTGDEKVQADMIALATAVDRLTKGRLHARWKGALAGTSKPAPWEGEGGLEAFRAKIAAGMRTKKAKKRAAAALYSANVEEGNGSMRETAGELTSMPSDGDVDAAVRRAMDRFDVRRREAAAEAVRFEADLPSDQEYQKYVRARELWEGETGAKDVWEAYRSTDGANLKERRNRGDAFEDDGGARCFAAIAVVLARKTGRPTSSYGYIRGARWRADRCRRRTGGRGGTKWVGEIDLVVLQGDEVAALCEMKAGCFEIASAFTQHEAKLTAALEAADSMTESSVEAQTNIQIVAPDGDILKLPSCKEASSSTAASVEDVPIFVATVLPEHDIIGVEPAMSQAVCDGIRTQGRNVWDRSTEEAARHAALPEPLRIGLSRSTPEAMDGGNNYLLEDFPNLIDLEELERYVRAKIGPERESPAGCLARRGERILVLTPSSIRWNIYSDVDKINVPAT